MRAFFILIYLLFMNFLKCPCIIISARAIFISIIIFFEEELLGKVLPQTPSQNFLSYISYNKSPYAIVGVGLFYNPSPSLRVSPHFVIARSANDEAIFNRLLNM